MINHRSIVAFRRILILLLVFCFAIVPEMQAQNAKTEILWDNFGVPHIYGKNAKEMYYAFGWAQMNNHADLILKLYGQARGRAAEYWGKEFFESDKQILLFNLPAQARISYQKQEKEYQIYLDAFVKGMNDFAVKHPEIIGEKFRQVLPVTVYDVISHTQRITCLEFLAPEDIYMAKKMAEAGSNSIAIASSKSASKNAMLLTNPHLPWSDYFLWFEAHLNTNGFTAYGIALVGMPSLSMAFNDNLGWAHTVNPLDASDRYELTLKGDGYLLDGATVPFIKKVVSIKVKEDNGSLSVHKTELKYSKHGPIAGEKGNKAYAVRIAGLENVRIFEQYHKMASAKNLKEFESALRMLQNPMFNVIYADKSGNILYVFNGDIPKRSRGDYSFWKGTIDGTDSKLIWKDIHPYEDLPRLLNPPSGFIQNCNDPPWTCTYPTILDPKKYPSYMAPPGGMFLRPQRAVNLVKDNPSVSFEQLIDYKLNTGMETADRFLDELLAAVKNVPDSTIQKAAVVLKKWDRKTDAGSRGAVLFTLWWDEIRNNMFAVPWNKDEPVTTPRGFKDQKQIADLLAKAANSTINKYGSLDIAWGDVYRFRMPGMDYPANGGPDMYGIFRTIYFADDSDNKKHAIAGDTYIAVTEFGDKVKAQLMLSYGNATQPGNKHVGDQLKMLSEKKLRPALLDRESIIKNLEKQETLSPKY